MSETDVAVIGSGFGGLTAALLSAASGLRVSVFEQHTRPGGCAGDFALGGFSFPAGATVVTGLEPGGILSQVYQAGGIDIDATEIDPAIVLHVGERQIPLWSDRERWLDELARSFPGMPEGYRHFWNWAGRTGAAVRDTGNRLPSFPWEILADVRWSLPALRLANLKLLPEFFRTVEDVKLRFGAVGHAEADAVIDGLLLDATGAKATECSAAQGAVALDIYRHGCQNVRGGTGGMALSMVRRIRELGAVVKFGTAVRSARRERHGWRIVTDCGEVTHARTVIANVPPSAADALLGASHGASASVDSWGAFVLHLGIDASGLDNMAPFHQVITPSDAFSAEGDNCLVSIFPSKTRPERWSISVSTHTEAQSWRGGEADGPRRHALEQRLLAAVRDVIPDVDGRVRLLQSATPRTYERFTLRPGGYVGGPIQRPGLPVLKGPTRRRRGGMFLAGDHIFPGQGTIGTALSGVNAYRDVCRHLGKESML